MSQSQAFPAPVVDAASVAWTKHPRFTSIQIKPLITAELNPLASVNQVRVPPGDAVGRHSHGDHVETIYVLAGRSVLRIANTEVPFNAGHIVAVPAGLEHELRNEGSEPVDLLTFFTPALT